MLLMVGGMIPVRLFQDSRKTDRLDRRPTPEGISPTREFLERSRVLSLEQFTIESGILPCNMLLLRFRISSLWRRLRGGNSPEKPFADRSSVVRKVKFPREEEIEPANLFPENSSAVTRPGCVTLHLTPFHMQWLVLEFQELSTPVGSLAALKASSERTSVVLSGTVEQLILLEPWNNSNSGSNISMVSFAG